MRCTVLRLTALLAIATGCGSVDDPARCATSADCVAGEYCASAEGERRCWPDGHDPVVSDVTVRCLGAAAGEACPRDGTLRVTATATDVEELAEVRAALTLAPGASVVMVRSGATWTADLPLAAAPVPAFEATVDAIVTGRDGARRSASVTTTAAIPVTRLRWTREVEPGVPVALTPAAVMPDGTVVVAGSNGKVYFTSPDGTQAHAPVTVGAGQAISAAPAIGTKAIWVGSEDGWLRGLALDGSGALLGVAVNSEGPIRGSVAVLTEPTREWGFVASTSGRLAGASSAGGTDITGAAGAYAVGPVMDRNEWVYAATSSRTSVIRSYSFDSAFTDRWGVTPPVVGVSVEVPLVIAKNDEVLSVGQDGLVSSTTSSGQTSLLATLTDIATDSPVILSNGDIVVGDQSGVLHRLSSSGVAVWAQPKRLSGPVLSPLVLADTSATLIVPTRSGTVYALDGSGAQIWSHTLGTGAELRSGNLHTKPGQPPGQVTSTAYYPTSDGKLHAVIVDGRLDTSAPWPKAFHDPRNTSNAGTTP
ncbi:PQQ-binding-like beta-propeller repeat protein [Anaeromyxobacter oryzisoli]|uniref:pyrrolo-quinoline quinone n=1 Tax=Anaeromyxobacter oryzisoli TaxID=2925408 RepID=UPI001F5AEA2D|nr:pyrrolo-quinoline quinone [Anaeromyxobacter sp. SG63]